MSTNNHPFLDQLLQTKPSFLTMGKTVKWQPNSIEAAPNCPRCFSTNTKFCYYNNYSISQPRYFCKGCRRYWTRGGTLRKVPVGGKSRRKSSGSVDDVSAAKAKDGDLIKGCDEGCSFDQPNKMDGGDCMYEGFGVEGFGGGSEMVWAEQPLMEEFEVFDERLRMWDESLMSGDWGSFDLSAYENL